MEYLFDQIVDRRDTNSLKHDFAQANGLPADVLPLWVADMDFTAPPTVLDALHKAVSHGIFGYSDTRTGYYEAAAAWFDRRFHWRPQEDWLVKTPGIVFAVAMAVRALTEEGDAVLVQPPVYYPFFNVVRENRRRIVEAPLCYEDGRYTIDFAGFEETICREQVKLFILCSPHNPTGRVWTLEELREMGRICKEHGVFVLSDEIHCDFAFPEHPHTIFLAAVPEMADRAIVCTAPSKTFNLAGLQASNLWVPSGEVRGRLQAEISRAGWSSLNTLGIVACEAAYRTGEDWLEQCKRYMRGNLDLVRDFLAEEIPQIRLVEPEGTYFAWLDCTGLGLDDEALDGLIVHKAKLWLDAGHIFGTGGSGFQRVVLASPRSTIQQALEQLKAAVD